MAKLKKEELKSLIKECLIEILSEGLDISRKSKHNLSSHLEENTNYKNENYPRYIKEILPNKDYEKNVSNVIEKTTSDPVLKEIFADTMQTTLQEQNQADRKKGYIKPKDHISQIVENNDPADLFGDASNNWAALAFSDSKK